MTRASMPAGPSGPLLAAFSGTSRFEIIRRIGEGGYGAVYEAKDRETKQHVAIKVLTRAGPEHVMRFKQEFRALSDIEHPNLVRLGELFEDEGRWFFTMELIEGIDLLDFVRGGPSDEGAEHANLPFDPPRLRAAFAQLVGGVAALHRAGKIHRDIKPSNIQVTEEGRVILFDFGLVTTVGGLITTEALAVGTAAYMAPEQATGVPVGPAADWYSVGVVLYEALTGRLPFTGTAFEMLLAKQSSEPVPPRALFPEIPADLSALCVGLIKPRPEQRLPAEQIVLGAEAASGSDAEGERVSPSLAPLARGVPFVGREQERTTLRRIAECVAERNTLAVVCMHGESGVGKTALLGEFTKEIEATYENVVVLSGRCHERETVPYKAFDGVVDALTRFLRSLSDRQCAQFLPAKAQTLPLVFPVLGRIKAITVQAGTRTGDADRGTLRKTALSALREMLVRIAEQRLLIIVIDDLQWADLESLALLSEIVLSSEAPPIMFVLAARDLDECPPEVQALLRELSSSVGLIEQMQLGGLPFEDARKLAASLLEGRAGSMVDPAALAREAQGQPLFIDALVRYSQEVNLAAGARPELDDALRFRIGQVDHDCRKLLELISVAAAPLQPSTVADALGWSASQTGAVMGKLRVLKLVRTSRMRQGEALETFHDRIRQATVSRLTAADRKRLHRQLAEAIEASEWLDAEAASFHWREAGVVEKAVTYAVRAADRAIETLAFDKAARLYREAIAFEPGRRREVAVKLADALSAAGRGQEAADAYLNALEVSPPEHQNELRRRAAQQLLGCGNIDAGLSVASDLLRTIGVHVSEAPRSNHLSLLYHRLRLAWRGSAFEERSVSDVPEQQLSRVDTLWAVAALGMVDHIRGADLQALHLLAALEAGEPYRVARALAMEAWLRAHFARGRGKSEAAITQAIAIGKRVQQPHVLALCDLARGVQAYGRGRFVEARDHCDSAESALRESGRGLAWEITSARLFAAQGALFAGDFIDLKRRLAGPLRESKERGDRYAYTNLTTGVGYLLWLAQGDVTRARAEVEGALAGWSQSGFFVQHYMAMVARIQLALSEHDAEGAARLADEAFPALESSTLLGEEAVALNTYWTRSRAYAAAARAQPNERRQRLRVVLADAKRLDKLSNELAPVAAKLLRASVAYVEGQRESAGAELLALETICAERGLKLMELAVRWARAGLLDQASASTLRSAVFEAAGKLGVVAPRVLFRLYWPFDSELQSEACPGME